MNRFLIGVFMLSGLAGLIYESIWSHYIKLLLGHASYAQSLVLVIFMGGMAIGAWLVSRFSQRLRNLLLAYAIVELLIGILGMGFHPVFEFTSALLLDSIIPAVGSGSLVTIIKISVAALLILPQSILLGATFPLMSGAIIRRWPGNTGASISILYFANSIGAVVGVLWSGFWLVDQVGLPGALLTAGLINIAIAIVIYLPTKTPEQAPLNVTPSDNEAGPMTWLLWAAAITGAASFCYEIAWIRMLSMVLGSSTHSFELMLAAFILGLALGGLWIRRRIDSIANPQRFLGKVQIFMGVLALLTLPLYNHTFDMMAGILHGLARTEQGYVLFSLSGHAIALLIMLPATFCAGMTLPLLTLLLWKSGAGEIAIGRVYSANTLGAIVGVVVAVHLIMSTFGLKYLLIFGALLDGALGIYLLGQINSGARLKSAFSFMDKPQRAWALGFVFVLLTCAVMAELDPERMDSSVYRHARATLSSNIKVMRWADGKTASIGLTKSQQGIVSISTNGKTDASINVTQRGNVTADELTMGMAAIIPMMYKPHIEQVANVGFGSGMTTHVLLANPGIKQVDTVEIEAEMVKSARLGFSSALPRAFDDDRSKVYIEDARVFFARQGKRYDLIVSEPSNPWVSGTASLFSEEFYRHVRRYLNKDGIFVQWLQLYETDPSIVASVLSALGNNFADYRIYTTADADLLIIASPDRILDQPDKRILSIPSIEKELKQMGLTGYNDIGAHYLGSKAVWSPWVRQQGKPANSDYFPYVDLNAARYRFMGKDARSLMRLDSYPVPMLELLDGSMGWVGEKSWSKGSDGYFTKGANINQARNIYAALQKGQMALMSPDLQRSLATLQSGKYCKETEKAQITALNALASQTTSFLNPREMREIWTTLRAQSPCLKGSPNLANWFAFYEALGERQVTAMGRNAGILIDTNSDLHPDILEQLIVAEMLSRLLDQDADGFNRVVQQHLIPTVQRLNASRLPASVDFLLGQALAKGWKV